MSDEMKSDRARNNRYRKELCFMSVRPSRVRNGGLLGFNSAHQVLKTRVGSQIFEVLIFRKVDHFRLMLVIGFLQPVEGLFPASEPRLTCGKPNWRNVIMSGKLPEFSHGCFDFLRVF